MTAKQIIEMARTAPFAFMQVGYVRPTGPFKDKIDAWLAAAGERFPDSAAELDAMSVDEVARLVTTVDRDIATNQSAGSWLKGEATEPLRDALFDYYETRASAGNQSVSS